MKLFYKQFLSIILLLGSFNCYSQIFKPGIIIGAVTTDLDGIDPYDNDFHKAGFTAGGLLNAKLSEKNSLQFEILYTQKGTLQPADSTNNYIYYKLKTNKLHFRFQFYTKSFFNFFLCQTH